MDDRSDKAKLMDGRRKHKLLTAKIKNKMPMLYETDGVPLHEKDILVKFFCPYSNWKWYGCEYDPESRTFLGRTDGHEKEWGYFSLGELEELDRNGLPLVERDCWFTPCKGVDIGEKIPIEEIAERVGVPKEERG